MKYRPKIGQGDFDTKTRQVAKFLTDGHKVKITIMFRGREVFHPELGKKILDRIAEFTEGNAKIESEPRLDGRNMVMVLAPDKRARQSQAARSAAAPAEQAARPSRRPRPSRRRPRDRSDRPDVDPTGESQTTRLIMPKMKTDRGAAARFKMTGTGKLMRRKPFKSHLLEKKSSVRTRRLGREAEVAPERPPQRPPDPRDLIRPAARRTRSGAAAVGVLTERSIMARVKRAVHAKKSHRTVLGRAEGYYGNKSRSFRAANEQVMHSLQYAYRDRRARKGEFRRLWIQRINAASRAEGMSYSRLIAGLHRAEVEIDRKVLADIAVRDAAAFAALVDIARRSLDAASPAEPPKADASEAAS